MDRATVRRFRSETNYPFELNIYEELLKKTPHPPTNLPQRSLITLLTLIPLAFLVTPSIRSKENLNKTRVHNARTEQNITKKVA